MDYVYLRANGHRRAVLSPHPLRDISFMELQPQAGFFEHRVVLGATAIRPEGDVGVYVTHLTNGDPEINRSQAESLVSFVASGSDDFAILAGDFNATDDSPQIEPVTQQAVDIYGATHAEGSGFTCCVDDLSSPPRSTDQAHRPRIPVRID